MEIEFIGHAGFWIKGQNYELVMDPWLFPSTLEEPILKSFSSSAKTIDYLIPEPVITFDKINPDYILISHFHVHHGPLKEIDMWLNQSKKCITIIAPKTNSKGYENSLDLMQSAYPRHRFIFLDIDTELNICGDLILKVLTHTTNEHLAFFLSNRKFSILHLADSIISRSWYDRRLDVLWMKFKNLKPDLFLVTVSSTAYRGKSKEGAPYLRENGFLSPVEAANLTNLINPKNVAVMGIFNFSIWKNRTEYGYNCYETEGFFRWAINHLRPDIAVQTLRPGDRFLADASTEALLKMSGTYR